jgi:hypothetical protein
LLFSSQTSRVAVKRFGLIERMPGGVSAGQKNVGKKFSTRGICLCAARSREAFEVASESGASGINSPISHRRAGM